MNIVPENESDLEVEWQAIHDLNDALIDRLQKELESCEDESSKKVAKILKSKKFWFGLGIATTVVVEIAALLTFGVGIEVRTLEDIENA